jgi:hypothetical protein
MGLFYLNPNLSSPDRFDPGAFMAYTDNYDPLTSQFLKLLPTLAVAGKWTVTTEISRPDLIANEVYGDTQYWWILMFFNDIILIEDLVINTVVNYPSLSDLETLYFSLRTQERASS